jgi:putative phosphoribosyl transferase
MRENAGRRDADKGAVQRRVAVSSGPVQLQGSLDLPGAPRGIVVFAHGAGAGRRAPGDGLVTAALREARLATLLLDLLTPDEDAAYAARFHIGLLTTRLAAAVKWVEAHPETATLPIGLLGASTGAAAALQVAAALRAEIRAVVSRGGRPDLAGRKALALVKAPTLLVVGGGDREVLALNERALETLRCEKELAVVPGAARLLERPAAPGTVAALATAWFARHLPRASGDQARRAE